MANATSALQTLSLEERRERRRALMQEALARKLAELFDGRRYDIVREIHLPEGQVFVTALGNQARHGYLLQDRDTGVQIAIGFKILRKAHDQYLAVNLPYKPRGPRKKKPAG